MELFMALALLCQVSTGITFSALDVTDQHQLKCQQSYIHCVNVKTTLPKQEALEKCIMEK